MSKEDSIAELEHDIRSLEEKIEELRSAEEPNFGDLSRLEDILDEKKNALEELTTEMAQNSGVDFEDAVENEREKDTKDDSDNREQKTREEEEKRLEEEREEQENQEDEKNEEETTHQETQDEISDQETQEEMNKDDGEKRLTLVEWQLRTGIDIVADESIRRKYDKNLTESEFKEILNNENVPKIIKNPGSAEKYLKSAEDWENVKTSKSALEEAIRVGNFPVDVNDDSYILLQYDKNTIRDTDKDGEEGRGEINEDEIRAALGEKNVNDDKASKSQEFEDERLNSMVQSDGIKEYMMARDIVEYMELANEIGEEATIVPLQAENAEMKTMIASSLSEGIGDVTKKEIDSTTAEMLHTLLNPYEEELEEDRDMDDEIPMPGQKRPY